jgi:hypothetical protein
VDEKLKIVRRIDNLKHFFEDRNDLLKQDNRDRPSYIKLNTIHKIHGYPYGYVSNLIIDPPSSGEESGMEDVKLNEPTVPDVANTMVDLNTLMTVKSPSDFPNEGKPSILLYNLEDWVTPDYVRRFVEDVPIFMYKKYLNNKI